MPGLSAHGFGDGSTERGLAHARWTHEAQHPDAAVVVVRDIDTLLTERDRREVCVLAVVRSELLCTELATCALRFTAASLCNTHAHLHMYTRLMAMLSNVNAHFPEVPVSTSCCVNCIGII